MLPPHFHSSQVRLDRWRIPSVSARWSSTGEPKYLQEAQKRMAKISPIPNGQSARPSAVDHQYVADLAVGYLQSMLSPLYLP